MRNNNPTVSVILNCFNHELYVREAVQSVLQQDFDDFELILIDNGSTDGTRSILDGFSDNRIFRMYFEKNESLSRRLNQGISKSLGQYICILYSDDMMLPKKLSSQVSQFKSLPMDYGVVYCPALRFDQYSGRMWKCQCMTYCGDILRYMLTFFYEGPPDMCSPMIRRECFHTVSWHEDISSDGEAIFFRIACKWKFYFDPEPTVMLRDHALNMGKMLQHNHDAVILILDRLEDDPSFPARHFTNLVSLKAKMCRNSAWAALRGGTPDLGWVRRQLRRGFSLSNLVALHPRWLAALLITYLPKLLRGKINMLFDSARRHRGNSAFSSDC